MVEKIFEVIRSVAAEGVTILLVEQNANLALEFSQRAYVMESGPDHPRRLRRRAAGRPEGEGGYLGE